MQSMTEFLANLHAQGGKVGGIIRRFNSVLRMTQASSGNATAACLSAAACAAYQTRLSKENFAELAAHIYEAERGPKAPHVGYTPLAQTLVRTAAEARPGESYQDDHGFVLWWRFPVNEPPWVGTPNCDDWPGYHTHWTPLPPPPAEPKGEAPDATRTA